MLLKFDIICLGRAGVDIYAQQIGSRLEDVQSFAKYIGGSSCNIAYGCARLGLKASMLTRVGNDHMGRFIIETLKKAGVDVGNIQYDPQRLTGLVLLGIKDQEVFPLIFYRKDCADMAIVEEDITEDYIANSKSLLITGTHFSTNKTSLVCQRAITYAKNNGVKLILDIDYRPVLWGLASLDQGENRFIRSDLVSQHLQSFIKDFDLIVGTEEEFNIAGGSEDIITSLKTVRSCSSATLVVKRGVAGNSVLDKESLIPSKISNVPLFPSLKIEVLNVLGAGDAFMSGFLKGWLNNESYEKCSLYANACGALVVSRHGCAPAIPSWDELSYYLNNRNTIKRIDKDKTLNFLHKVTNRTKHWNELYVLAFDHRFQLEELTSSFKLIIESKKIIGSVIREFCLEGRYKDNLGLIIDSQFGQSILNEFTGQNIFIARPIEKSSKKLAGLKSKELDFEISENAGSLGSELITWPQEQVVKCFWEITALDDLISFENSLRKIKILFNDCLVLNRELLLEVLVQEKGMISDEKLLVVLEKIYQAEIKPDWWKLLLTSENAWKKLQKIIHSYDPHCRGVLVLGNNEKTQKLVNSFSIAKKFKIIKGFAIGRSIFLQPIKDFIAKKNNVEVTKQKIKKKFENIIKLWKKN